MWPLNNHVGAALARISSPPRPTPTPATGDGGEPLARIDEHGHIHGVLSGARGGPARGWAGLPPGHFDVQAGSSGVVPPLSPATVMRVQAEESSEEKEASDEDAYSYVETDEDLVKLVLEKSLRSERRQAKKRRRYEQQLEAYNASQLERGLRADAEMQAKRREWDAIAAAQLDHVGHSLSSDSSDD